MKPVRSTRDKYKNKINRTALRVVVSRLDFASSLLSSVPPCCLSFSSRFAARVREIIKRPGVLRETIVTSEAVSPIERGRGEASLLRPATNCSSERRYLAPHLATRTLGRPGFLLLLLHLLFLLLPTPSAVNRVSSLSCARYIETVSCSEMLLNRVSMRYRVTRAFILFDIGTSKAPKASTDAFTERERERDAKLFDAYFIPEMFTRDVEFAYSLYAR